MIIDKCNACEYSMIQGRDLYFCNVKGKYITHCFDCYTYRLYNTLQEIKAIVETPKPFIDFSDTKTATEVEYDYAAICNELESRLHKVLEKITKAEEE